MIALESAAHHADGRADARHRGIEMTSRFAAIIGDALAVRGPVLVEVDMAAIGPMKVPFAGPGG